MESRTSRDTTRPRDGSALGLDQEHLRVLYLTLIRRYDSLAFFDLMSRQKLRPRC